jgi:hypothetical protein
VLPDAVISRRDSARSGRSLSQGRPASLGATNRHPKRAGSTFRGVVLASLLSAFATGSAFLTVACSKTEAKVEPVGSGANATFVEVRVHPSGSEALSAVLAREAKKAGEKNLRPFVEIGASWCEPCRAIESAMDEPSMKTAFAGTYVIHLDASEWGGELGKVGLGSAQIPVFFALDASGKATGRRIDGSAWGESIPDNVAPKLWVFFKGT